MAQLGALVAAALSLLVAWAWSSIRWRRYTRFVGFPQPKTSMFWGNMRTMHEQIMTGGTVNDIERHGDMALSEIRKQLGMPSSFAVDIWPMNPPLLVIADHELAERISKVSKQYPYSVPKSPTVWALHHIIGPESILMAESEHWKSLRKRFNPGFAPQHLMTLLPCILDKTRIFLDHLDRFAETGEEFKMDYYATGLTFDIIGAVVMDLDFRAQDVEERQSEVLKLFRALGATYDGFSNRLPLWMQPRLVRKRARLAGSIDKLLSAQIRDKFDEIRREAAANGAAAAGGKKSRSVLSLSLQGVDRLDARYVSQTCDQLKTFLFAGHDTTSILLQWAFYELSRTPRALAALRAELDDVFGADTGDDADAVAGLLRRRGDELLQRLSYTSAVIKETLRLHPPAGSARLIPAGTGFVVPGPLGRDVCLDGLVLYLCQSMIQRDPAVYGETADIFAPERWLGDADTSMSTNSGLELNEKAGAGGKIPPSAWRPFERGPRNCIGQELANIEARVILALTVRRYDFIKAGKGELDLDAAGRPQLLEATDQYKTKSPLYNTFHVTSKPIDGCIMTVKLSEKAS